MPDSFLLDRMETGDFPEDAVVDISNGGKIIIISDLHMGTGPRDDLNHNGAMVTCLLEEYYFKNGWILVLNGDIEELYKYSLDQIHEKWPGIYRVFNLFAEEKRLYKIAGNHDELLLSKKYYPYPLFNIIKIETGIVKAFVYHGHQWSSIYMRFNKFFRFMVRYFLGPAGIRNIADSRSPHKRFHIEKKAYAFSIKNHCLSIIGHTHRPLFESLGRFDYIKFEVERLCRGYPTSSGDDRRRIEEEVTALRSELGKLKKKERRDVLRQSLYGDELPVPCLFNSGSALGKKGITAIEMTGEEIALVYWFTEGKSKKFIKRGDYCIESLPETPYRRAVLNHNKLDYISAKIKLLGNNQGH